MFIGRKNELKTLEKFYSRESFQLVTLYGRRRVGKTELIQQFIKNKEALFFSAEETTSLENLRKLSKEYEKFIEKPIGTFGNWDDFFNALDYESKKYIFVIDELPYICESDTSFLSKFQHAIDHSLKSKNIMIILCGSSISFMEGLLSEKSPIFGRETGNILLRALPYYDAIKMLPKMKNIDRLEAFFLLGGIPEYLKQFSSYSDYNHAIVERILDRSELLFQVPNNFLKMELRNPAIYNAIIGAIAEGASKQNEIMTKVGLMPATGQRYLDTLIKLDILERLHPINNITKRKSIYRIKDPLFEFIYRFAYHYRTNIERGDGQLTFDNFIKPNLNTYFGHQFEKIVFEYIHVQNSSLLLPDYYHTIGKWWGGNPISKTEEEIDIVAFSNHSSLFVECKYKNSPVDTHTLEALIQKSHLLSRTNCHYMIASKGGFTNSLKQRASQDPTIHLVDLDEILSL
ncbi:ATP-binding protein [Acidaminobacter sp. JC074]|uniref:ATP-binding protein n=1 Tax=Acidaminobacter sp. JC074 TaxID=2530199 RepID=UPI001F0ED254|nr:ATP-binding protein [Acidaminobacter sp. JC074]MCH4886956.1 ATP-binding protein [Acidaminobacter sp. JC074]